VSQGGRLINENKDREKCPTQKNHNMRTFLGTRDMRKTREIRFWQFRLAMGRENKPGGGMWGEGGEISRKKPRLELITFSKGREDKKKGSSSDEKN